MNRRGFLKLLGAALGVASSIGVPDRWLAPAYVRISTGTYTGDGRTNRKVFFVNPAPVYKALRIIQETGKPNGSFNVKGALYRYEIF